MKLLNNWNLLFKCNGYDSITVYICKRAGGIECITLSYRDILLMSEQDAEAFAHDCVLSEVFK
jgi:methyl coenzyme M reductase gamma subunit